MEQNKMYREDFWNISGNAEEEMKECIKNAERKNNAALSIHAVLDDGSHSFLQVFLQPGIHRGSGFVENQDLGRFEDRPGNGQKLFLAL